MTMTELTTVDKAKRAIDLGCGLRMEYSFDIQSGGAWMVRARDFARVTQDFVWMDLGYVSGEDKRLIEDYAESVGRPFSEDKKGKCRTGRNWHTYVKEGFWF